MTDSWAPPRRPNKRAEETRNAILKAAQACFGSSGYDKATVRAIAADAGVDPAMVMRHFGSKADLFGAAVQLGFEVIDLTRVPRDGMGTALIRASLEPWERGETRAQAVLLRTAPTHPEAAQGVQAILDRQLLPTLEAVIPDDPDIALRAGLVQSEALGVIMTRYLLRIDPMASMDFELLVETFGDSVQRHLTRPLC
ncbi:TetR family transcriptional regulator [Streptomyces sp. Tue6028]|uniref:TetR/AcrR family transcriptional regulator n=1 Tax=Streptomyces sp. Tue6028 TaxID=2036037 RepID=UPI003D72AF92